MRYRLVNSDSDPDFEPISVIEAQALPKNSEFVYVNERSYTVVRVNHHVQLNGDSQLPDVLVVRR